jgi:hypothetical protein
MFAPSECDSELLRSVLRYLAWAMLSMGIYTLLSGGLNVISSCLVIALGSKWLAATSPGTPLKAHLDELDLLREKDCRGCCRNCCSGQCRGVLDDVRGLAIAAITFAVLELLVYMPYLSVMGTILTYRSTPYYNYNSQATCSSYPSVTGKTYTCSTGSQTYCTINYNNNLYYSPSSYSFQCYTGTTNSQCSVSLPYSASASCSLYNNYCYWSGGGDYSGSDYYSASIGQWLFYAVGHTAISAPLNIAWGAITLNLIGALTIRKAAAYADESTSLLSRGEAKPFFMAPVGAGSDKA